MKPTVALCLCAILVAASADISLAQNMIENPGFEEGEGAKPRQWYGTANAGAPTFTRTDEQAIEGKYSGKLAAKPGDVYARWVYRRSTLFRSVKPRDRLRLRFKYMASADLGDALVQISMDRPPGWRQYTLKPLKATGGKWVEYEAELIVDVVPSGSGELQLRGTTGQTGDQVVYFDDVSLEVIRTAPAPRPRPFIKPKGEREMLTPSRLRAIQCDTSRLPLKTAAHELRRFIGDRQSGASPTLERPVDGPVRRGTLVLGTTEDNPVLARWAGEGRLGISECSDTVDAYEIAVTDGCVAIVGANPRAVLYGAFELEDLLIERGGLPVGFHSKARPDLNLRLLHPRARGGFHSYEQADFEFIARAGANVAHLSHDWMAEKTLFSFVPCPEFPRAVTPATLENNRKHLRQYLEWCSLYGLRSALWLCEVVCQGGGWVPEPARRAFLERFPEDVLEDTGTSQGKVLCMAHPRVEKAYRGMVRRLLTDFPELEMVLVFTLDSNGEFCDPNQCPRHRDVSKYTQYNSFLRLLLEEGRAVRSDFKAFSVGWSWTFRNDPEYLTQLSALPKGAGLTAPPDGEAWSFDRKITDRLMEYRQVTRAHGQDFLGYDIFLWGDDCRFPETELYDFPLGVAAKLRRWQAIGADGFFDQWGTQAEFVPSNAVALRYMLFHPELAQPSRAQAFIEGLAGKQYGDAAAPHVVAAWREIETAQQIQSDHTYYWHHLRPNWAGPTLKCPLTLDALRKCRVSGAEPSKPYGAVDYCPYRDDGIAATRILGKALSRVAGHFERATAHFRAAIEVLDPGGRSLYEHWYPEGELSRRLRLTPRQSLEKQLVAVQLHAMNQRRMGLFFTAYSLVKSMPEEAEPGFAEALADLKAIREAARRYSAKFGMQKE